MNDKFMIAIIAAGSSILGVVVSSTVSFLLGMRSEKQKVAVSSAEYLRHKIQALEKCREHLFIDGKRVDLKKESKPDALARIAEESLDRGSSTVLRVAHYLPRTIAAELLEERDLLSATIARARGKYHGLLMKDDPNAERITDGSDILRRMASFSKQVAKAIDAELLRSTENINRIYRL